MDMVEQRRAEYLYYPPQCSVGSCMHVKWLYCQLVAVDSDHLRMAVDQRAKSLSTVMGHVTDMPRHPLQTSFLISRATGSAGGERRGNALNDGAF